MPMAAAPAAKISGGTINVATDKAVFKLKGNAVGLAGVLFLAVTGAAPMSAMLGNVPFAAGFGVGVGVTQATDHLLVKAILGYRFNNKKD